MNQSKLYVQSSFQLSADSHSRLRLIFVSYALVGKKRKKKKKKKKEKKKCHLVTNQAQIEIKHDELNRIFRPRRHRQLVSILISHQFLAIFSRSDWILSLLWIWLYDTQWKSALFGCNCFVSNKIKWFSLVSRKSTFSSFHSKQILCQRCIY